MVVIRAKRNGRPTGEKTAPQVLSSVMTYDNELPKDSDGIRKPSYTKVREMRKDATIAFARWLAVAPVLSSEWNIEGTNDAPKGAVEFIKEQLLPIKNPLVRSSFYGGLDFGWQPYEKVFHVTKNGQVGLKKIKQLLQDYTKILVNQHGEYIGLRQEASLSSVVSQDVDLHASKTLTVAFDVEGTDWYGHSSMEVVERVYDKYFDVEQGAHRYDKKLAGSHWIIQYPDGQSPYNGEITDNQVIARDVLNTLEASGSIAIPRDVSAFIGDPSDFNNESGWKVELISDSSTASSAFNERARYYDSLKVRSFGLPERAVLEGQFGTKAEAQSHADAAVLNMEMRHHSLVDQYNWHLVDHLLRLNYGEDAVRTVYIRVNPIVDKLRKSLTDIYLALLKNPKGYLGAFERIDMAALESQLQIPLTQETHEDFKKDVGSLLTDGDLINPQESTE